MPEQGPRLDTFACAHSLNQQWERRIVPQCTAHMVAALGVACSQLVNPSSGNCLTKVTTSGAAIGLDAGTTMVVAQARPCLPPGAPSQTFDLVNGDQSGFPKAFPIRSPVDNGDSDRELCLQPWVAKEYAARPGAGASDLPEHACLASREQSIGQAACLPVDWPTVASAAHYALAPRAGTAPPSTRWPSRRPTAPCRSSQ